MATTLYTKSIYTVKAYPNAALQVTGRVLDTSRGAVAAALPTMATVAGPTAGLAFNTGGAAFHFVSRPVDADFTMSGSITFNLRMLESSMSANCGAQCRVYRMSHEDGTLTLVIDSERGVELGTSESAQNWAATPGAGVNFARGDRIVIVLLVNDAGGTMASGYTVTCYTDGPTAGQSGDSYLTFTETIGFLDEVEPSGSKYRLTDDVSDVSLSGVDARKALTTAAGPGYARTTSSVAGWTNGLEAKNDDGNYLEWFTPQLNAFTLSGLVYGRIQLLSDTASAYAAGRVEIAVCDADGSNASIWGGTIGRETLDYRDGYGQIYSYIVGDSRSVTDGQRLRFRVFFDDSVVSGPLVVGHTLYACYNEGTDSADRAAWFHFAETITEYNPSTPKSGSDSGTGADTSNAPAVALTSTEAGTGGDALASVANATDTRTDSGAGADTAAPIDRALATVTDAGVGSDGNALVTVPKTATETGVGSDTAIPSAAYTSTEAGTGTDTAASPAVALPATEAGAGADTSQRIGVVATEAGAGADTAALAAASDVRTDAGTGADTATPAAAYASTDAGVGADAATGIGLATVDAGVGAEAATVDQGTVQKSAADAAVGTEAMASLDTATDTRVEAGTGADTASLAAVLTATEAGVGTDGNATTSVPIVGTDAGVGTETAGSPAVALTTTDTGSAQDTGSLAAATPVLTEAGVGTDGNAQVVEGLVEKSASDGGVGTETATVTALYAASDIGVGTELAALTVAFTATDSGVAADTSRAIDRALDTRTDAGAGSDLAATAALILALDAATGTDLVGGRAFVAFEAGVGSEAAIVSTGIPSIFMPSGTGEAAPPGPTMSPSSGRTLGRG